MEFDKLGKVHYTTQDVMSGLYQNDILLDEVSISDENEVRLFNDSVNRLYSDYGHLLLKSTEDYDDATVEAFDSDNQSNWYMPQEYKDLDIAEYVIGLCKTDAELQRVGEELMLFQDRNMFPLLQFLKYFVDTVQDSNLVMGVGRGSSVASYVMYLMNVHRIDSLFYGLDIKEFLR